MKMQGWVVIYCLVINFILVLFLNMFAKNIDIYLKFIFIDMCLMAISWAVASIIFFKSLMLGNNIFVKDEEA